MSGLGGSAPASAAVRAAGLRLGEHGGGATRVVLDLAGQVRHGHSYVANPDALILDLPALAWDTPPSVRPTGLVGAATYEADGVSGRIILGLRGPALVEKSFLIPPRDGQGWRLVVDLIPTDRASFMALARPHANVAGRPAEPDAPETAPAPAKATRRPMIILDPGHGGLDPGAISPSGLYEKNITLAIGRDLRRRLKESGRYDVGMTRDRDVSVSLRDRVEIGRRAKGDLFISLHADMIGDSSVRGLSVYTLSERASDNEAAALADRENKADIIAGLDLTHESPEVSQILIDLAQRETMNLSARFAAKLINELREEVKLLRRTHRFAGFAVLKAPDIPSVLVENGYLSNPVEERLLRQPAYRARLAQSMVGAIDRHFGLDQSARRPT